MTCIIYWDWDVGHSRMSLICLQNQSEKWPEPWSVAWGQTISIGTTWKLECSLTFYIPVWASSWGTRLYILFRSLSNIISLIWQTTAVLYLLRVVFKLQHMQQKQTFMAGQDYMGTLLASKYTNSSQSIVRHNEQTLEKPAGSDWIWINWYH